MAEQKKDRNLKRLLAILAVVLTAALFVELLFYLVDRGQRGQDYPRISFSSGDFIPHEYLSSDKTEETEFKALANDSYFELSDAGGIKAETIDFFLGRGENDNSEIVVYFTGRSGGVEGTFVAGLHPLGERHYRATADFERIDSLRIYPSEQNGSEIYFAGIELNVVVSAAQYSPSRVLLWGLLLAGLYSLYTIIRSAIKGNTSARRSKDPDSPSSQQGLWLRIYFPLAAAVALFAYLSADMFSSARSFGDLFIPLLTAAFTAFYLFLWFISQKVKPLYKKVFLLFLVVGAIFSFATAPLQVPDESVHFTRGYAIAMGSFDFDGKFDYPDGVDLLYDVFPENLNMYIETEGYAPARDRLSSYFSRLGETFSGETKAYSNQQLILPYLPSALGVLIARLFGMNALFALWLGRLMNVLMVALAAAFAVKRADRWQTPLLVVIFFPLTLFMAASFSYDAMLLAALMIFLGVLASDDIKKRDLLLLAASFAVIVMIKSLYLVLAPLIFAVPKESFKFRGNYLVMCLGLLVAGVAVWQLSLVYANIFAHDILPASVLPNVDKAAQTLYILRHPFRFVVVATINGFRTSFFIGDFGTFGHLDLVAPLTTVLAPAAMVAASALSVGEYRQLKKKNTGLFLGMVILIYFAVMAAFYVVDSVLGSSTILGVQARYFTPLYFLLVILLSGIFSKGLRAAKDLPKNRNAALYILFSVALLASLEVFFGYWI